MGTLRDSVSAAVGTTGSTGSTTGSEEAGEEGDGVVEPAPSESTAADVGAPEELACGDAWPLNGVEDWLGSADDDAESVVAVGVAGVGGAGSGVGELPLVVPACEGLDVWVGVGFRVGLAVPDGEGEDGLDPADVGVSDGVDVGAGVATECAVGDCPGTRRVPLCQARAM